MGTKHKFKCKDEVIYQNKMHFGDELPTWNYGIVNYDTDDYLYLVGGLYINKKAFKVLPYEGNEHLVGTTDEPEEEVKLELGDVCVFFDNLQQLNRISDLIIDQFLCAHETEDVLCQNGVGNKWEYAIRFSDFDPNDMEETRKHILCVKNGKVVRYKG